MHRSIAPTVVPCIVGCLFISACGSSSHKRLNLAPPKAPQAASASFDRSTEPAPEPEPVAKSLERSEISPVVKDRYMEISGCHAVSYASTADVTGTMVVDWVISPDGTVKSARVSDSSFDDAQVEQCVIEVTRQLEFPSSTGPTEVSWEFRFRGSE